MRWHDYLQADFLGPREWVLTESLTFEIEKSKVADVVNSISIWKLTDLKIRETDDLILITAPVGYKTDLASISRAMWSIISPWDVARGAVIHDALYGAIRKRKEQGALDKTSIKSLRKQADDIFKLGMESAEPKIPTWKVASCYYSVRGFGWTSINKKAKFNN